MFKYFLVLIIIIPLNGLFAQSKCFPLNTVTNYLLECGEIPPEEGKDNKYYENYVQHGLLLFDNDTTSAIYWFWMSSDHPYLFLLLKENTKYRILECDNFINEWTFLANTIKKINKNISLQTLENIMKPYQLRANSPWLLPLPNGKKWPRKLINPEPFNFQCL